MIEDQKYHYYSFSFIANSSANSQIHASLYWGLENNRVTMKTIAEAKPLAGVPSDAVLISVSYLGHMTSKEMNDDKNSE